MNKILKSNPKLIIASTNKGKINEFNDFFYDLPFDLKKMPGSLKINENGNSFIENARIKAIETAKLTESFCFADDSGLCIESLGGLPGIGSARYAKSDSERVDRVLKEMTAYKNRNAYFISALCIASPSDGVFLEVQGKCHGLITFSPRGINGFGYDPIFEVLPTGLTFAEMDIEQKRKFGHRGKAFQLLKPLLREKISSFY